MKKKAFAELAEKKLLGLCRVIHKFFRTEDKLEITALIGDENTGIPGLYLDSSFLVPNRKKLTLSKLNGMKL